MQWIRTWLESDGIGYAWFAQGLKEHTDAAAKEAKKFDMELEGWAADIESAKILCTNAQIRWFMEQRENVNQYVLPELKP